MRPPASSAAARRASTCSRATETSKHAAIHIQPRPGEDVTILAGLLALLFEWGALDHDFVAENVIGLDELRAAVDDSLAKSAKEEIREIDLLQDHLHDDVAEFVYEQLRRRPMILPVVVEV